MVPRGPDRIPLEPNWFYLGRRSSKRGHTGANWNEVSKPSQKRLPCIQCAGHWWAAEGRSGTLVWRATKGRLYWIMCMAGSRRPLQITHRLARWAAEDRPCLQFVDPWSKHFKRSLPAATQQKTIVFRLRLARHWRALISSIYIYIQLLIYTFIY